MTPATFVVGVILFFSSQAKLLRLMGILFD